jgi:hypothetical protein
MSLQTAYAFLALILAVVFAVATAKTASDEDRSPALRFVAGGVVGPGTPNCRVFSPNSRRIEPHARQVRLVVIVAFRYVHESG